MLVYAHALRFFLPFFTYAWNLPDIKADNIIFGIADESVFHDFMENELQSLAREKN
jgi:hypothetical protein